MEASAVLLVWLRGLENRLVDVGVELLCRLRGVESLQAVLLERVYEDVVGHLDAVMKGNQVGVVRLELLLGNGAEGAVEVVDRLYEVAGKALNGKVLCTLYFALCALLEVTEVGDGA